MKFDSKPIIPVFYLKVDPEFQFEFLECPIFFRIIRSSPTISLSDKYVEEIIPYESYIRSEQKSGFGLINKFCNFYLTVVKTEVEKCTI